MHPISKHVFLLKRLDTKFYIEVWKYRLQAEHLPIACKILTLIHLPKNGRVLKHRKQKKILIYSFNILKISLASIKRLLQSQLCLIFKYTHCTSHAYIILILAPNCPCSRNDHMSALRAHYVRYS